MISICPTCQAKFVDGKHFWSTGKPGNPLDLAGLVCNSLCGDRRCINPVKGQKGGDTWAKRRGDIDACLGEFGLLSESVDAPSV